MPRSGSKKEWEHRRELKRKGKARRTEKMIKDKVKGDGTTTKKMDKKRKEEGNGDRMDVKMMKKRKW